MRLGPTTCTLILAEAMPALGADVTYLPAATVSAAFERGAVLYDGAGTNYMVHASRRDAAGQAEVHLRDADVIYVLKEGRAKATPVILGQLVGSRIPVLGGLQKADQVVEDAAGLAPGARIRAKGR